MKGYGVVTSTHLLENSAMCTAGMSLMGVLYLSNWR